MEGWLAHFPLLTTHSFVDHIPAPTEHSLTKSGRNHLHIMLAIHPSTIMTTHSCPLSLFNALLFTLTTLCTASEMLKDVKFESEEQCLHVAQVCAQLFSGTHTHTHM